MNQDESMPAGYEASPAEMQNVITKWVKASEAFHRRYAKLTQVINTLQIAARRNPTASRANLRRLFEMRQRMSDVLMTLLLDMSGPQPGRSEQPSKPGQLHSHVTLLNEMNREIDAELVIATTVAQA